MKTIVTFHWVIFSFLTASLCGCASLDNDKAKFAREHVFMVDKEGVCLDPATVWKWAPKNNKESKDATLTNSLHRIEDGLTTWIHTNTPVNALGLPQRVVVFVHGGMNPYASSAKRLQDTNLLNSLAGSNCYPIFVVWNSGPFSSYWQHLVSIRQGEKHPVLGGITAPLMLATDLARGLVRLPLTLIGRYYSDWETGETPGSARTQRWENFETNVAGAHNFPTFHPPQPERDKRSWSERVIHGAEYLVTQPTKIATLPILDGMGTPAWDIMLRRTRTMFDPTRSYEIRELVKATAEESKTNQQASQFHVYRWLHPTGNDEDLNPTNAPSGTVLERGAMYFLSHEFMEWSTNHWTTSSNTITKLPFEFYGHSMGTIVLNQMFRNQRGIQADRITYLAAACSIDDFRTAMFPYLRWHSDTEVYSLSLHRIRERDEFPIKWPIPFARDLIARGSLLNWIDDLLAKPNSIGDRTLGAWENAIRALPDVPPELRPQIYFRECELEPQRAWSGGEGTYEPQAHGDFPRSYYWSKDFLWPTTTTNQMKLRAN